MRQLILKTLLVLAASVMFSSCPCDCNNETEVCYHTPDMFDCRDGWVGIDELLFVLRNWGPCEDIQCLCHPDTGPPWDYSDCMCCEWGDINRDHEIGILDFILIIENWGQFDSLEWEETRCRPL